MARPWRVQYEGATYHVASRGNGRQNIFTNNSDRNDFLALLARATERFNLEIFAFCLMSNHYHLLLRTPGANLSAAMQWLNTIYAVRFKIRRRRSGHFFQGRFKSVLVEAEPHWQYLSFYIHLNPVRAQIVESPASYEWSSFRDYVRPNSRFDWLCRDEVLSGFGSNGPARRREYRRHCMGMSGKPREFWKDARESVVIGSQEFIENIKEKFSPSGRKEDVPEYKKLASEGVDPDRELEKLAEALKIDAAVFMKRAEVLPARLLAYHHLVERRGMSQTGVGEHFGVSGCAVSWGIKRLKAMADKDIKLKKLMEMSNVKV